MTSGIHRISSFDMLSFVDFKNSYLFLILNINVFNMFNMDIVGNFEYIIVNIYSCYLFNFMFLYRYNIKDAWKELKFIG